MLERVISFDKTQTSECRIEQPDKYNALYALKAKKIIARGASLSYCNAAAANGGVVVDMRHFNLRRQRVGINRKAVIV